MTVRDYVWDGCPNCDGRGRPPRRERLLTLAARGSVEPRQSAGISAPRSRARAIWRGDAARPNACLGVAKRQSGVGSSACLPFSLPTFCPRCHTSPVPILCAWSSLPPHSPFQVDVITVPRHRRHWPPSTGRVLRTAMANKAPHASRDIFQQNESSDSIALATYRLQLASRPRCRRCTSPRRRWASLPTAPAPSCTGGLYLAGGAAYQACGAAGMFASMGMVFFPPLANRASGGTYLTLTNTRGRLVAPHAHPRCRGGRQRLVVLRGGGGRASLPGLPAVGGCHFARAAESATDGRPR